MINIKNLTNFLLLFCLSMSTSYGQNLIEQNWNQFYTFQNSVKNTAVDVNASGDLFVTGHVDNGIEGNNIVTVKYDANGSMLWAQQYHLSSDDYGVKNECDNTGNIYTLGSVETGGGATATVLIKYNATGVQQWTYFVSLGMSNSPIDLFVKSGGDVYILSENIISGQKDAVISVVNPSGFLINQQTYDSGYEDTPIDFDYNAGKIVVGISHNNLGTITSSIMQYSTTLSLEWTYSFTGTGADDIKSVKFDNIGNSIALVGVGIGNKAEITKMSSSGIFQWNISLDDNNTIHNDQSMFIDGLNNIIVAYGHNSQKEISTALINPMGEKTWNKYYYGNNNYYAKVGVVSDGSRIICGATETDMLVGKMFAFSLDYNAAFQWEYREDCGMSGQLSDFAINTNSHIVLIGQKETGVQYKIGIVDLKEKPAYDAPDESGNNSGHLAYFQNLGRIKDFDGNTVNGLSYGGVFGDEALYFFKNSIAFTYYKSDFDETTVDSIYRLDFLFTGDVNAKNPTGIHPVKYHNNYYTANIKRERVNGYKKIVYSDLYDNIDLEVSENEFGPVFSFIIYPSGDIGDIEWEVDGATELYGGYLDSVIISQFRQFSTPILYTEDAMGDPLTIPYDTVSYGYDIDSSGRIVFDFPKMVNSTNFPIVVQLGRSGTHHERSADDNFNWCSYIRNPGKEAWRANIIKIDSDDANNTYYAGSVAAKIDGDGVFPTTPGAAYELPLGARDITVMKLNDDVEIQWATYYGGTGTDYARSISVNPTGSLVYVVGRSESTDFPTADGAGGAYVNGSVGTSFILQLNEEGTAYWATKFPATLRDCETIGSSLFVVGSRMDVSTPTLLDDMSNYYSTNGSGYIGVFKAGGIYTHGTGFGNTTSYGLHTDIYGIDWDGTTNYAITGESGDPNHPLINAPTNHEYKSSGGNNNAFVASIKTNGVIDFSYYISSVEPLGLVTFGAGDEFYFSLGDRGNDVKYSPDGNSVYVVGEVFGEDLYTVASADTDAYYQANRFPADNGAGAYRPAGFIYKSEINGDELLLTYFSASEPIETYFMFTRLEEISFDDLGNYYISGHQTSTTIEDAPIPTEFNIPLPYAQPLGFYQESVPTNSSLDCVGGIVSESYIIGFNKDDKHIWTTYVGGARKDQLKPIAVTGSRHLYFGGIAQTINANWGTMCPDATDEEIKEVEFPIWDYDTGSDLDWYNKYGGSDESEFAGRFDVNGVNDAGPPLSVNKENEINNNLIIYPNPISKGDLYLSVNREQINKVVIYSIDGKTILDINQIDIKHVNIDKLTKGTYIVMCQTNSGSYNSKFIKN